MRIGIDIGGTTISCALVGDGGSIVAKSSFDTDKDRPCAEIISDIADSVYTVLESGGRGLDAVDSIGVGCPGIIDRQNGTVIYSNNIAWENVPLVAALRERLPKEIYIDNDANCAAWGEYTCGAAKGSSSSVTITLGTGVGGGIILDGRIHAGFNSAANAVGHMVIVSGGEPCTCGRRGCWEAYASVTALIRMANQYADQYPDSLLAEKRRRDGRYNGKNTFDAARAGDPAALMLLDQYCLYVAEGITDLVNVLQPEVVVIGGGISYEGDFLLNPIKRHIREGVYCKQVPLPRVVISALNSDAGIVGAAHLKGYQTSGGKCLE